MTEMTDQQFHDMNAGVVTEFRENGGCVGGMFEGTDLLLLHHRGRRTGRETISPVAYARSDQDPTTLLVVATRGGAPTHPAWYHNLVAAGRVTVEIADEARVRTEDLAVRELTGAEYQRVMTDLRAKWPQIADYERQVEGIRTIPLLALTP